MIHLSHYSTLYLPKSVMQKESTDSAITITAKPKTNYMNNNNNNNYVNNNNNYMNNNNNNNYVNNNNNNYMNNNNNNDYMNNNNNNNYMNNHNNNNYMNNNNNNNCVNNNNNNKYMNINNTNNYMNNNNNNNYMKNNNNNNYMNNNNNNCMNNNNNNNYMNNNNNNNCENNNNSYDNKCINSNNNYPQNNAVCNTSDCPVVTFLNTPVNYVPGSDIIVRYRLMGKFASHVGDWIGIFARNWLMLDEHVTKQPVPNSTRRNKNNALKFLTIPAYNIQDDADHGTEYQLAYVTEDRRIMGLSDFFTIRDQTITDHYVEEQGQYEPVAQIDPETQTAFVIRVLDSLSTYNGAAWDQREDIIQAQADHVTVETESSSTDVLRDQILIADDVTHMPGSTVIHQSSAAVDHVLSPVDFTVTPSGTVIICNTELIVAMEPEIHPHREDTEHSLVPANQEQTVALRNDSICMLLEDSVLECVQDPPRINELEERVHQLSEEIGEKNTLLDEFSAHIMNLVSDKTQMTIINENFSQEVTELKIQLRRKQRGSPYSRRISGIQTDNTQERIRSEIQKTNHTVHTQMTFTGQVNAETLTDSTNQNVFIVNTWPSKRYSDAVKTVSGKSAGNNVNCDPELGKVWTRQHKESAASATKSDRPCVADDQTMSKVEKKQKKQQPLCARKSAPSWASQATHHHNMTSTKHPSMTTYAAKHPTMTSPATKHPNVTSLTTQHDIKTSHITPRLNVPSHIILQSKVTSSGAKSTAADVTQKGTDVTQAATQLRVNTKRQPEEGRSRNNLKGNKLPPWR